MIPEPSSYSWSQKENFFHYFIIWNGGKLEVFDRTPVSDWVPFYPNLLQIFIMNGCWISWNFCIYLDDHVIFLLSFF